MKKQYVALILLATIISFQLIRSAVVQHIQRKKMLEMVKDIPAFHTPKEHKFFSDNLRGGPIEPGEYFLHSDNCKGCHGYDSLGYGLTSGGVDVNIYDDWRATMMANSARDPMWRAKVSHEILVNPSHANELQNTCTSCHAPMGHYTSRYKGNPFYTIADMLSDSLGLDGIACFACHVIGENGLGTTFSGEIPFDTINHALYGPFTNLQTGPMQLYVGMTPIFSPHVSEGRMCSSCHTLLTNSVDLSGNPTGRKFVEQATYHEWLNSNYFQDFVTCQSCHMPKSADSVRIATGYAGLENRFPFNEHTFSGSNVFMLKLMKDNKVTLGIPATDANYDSVIVANEILLRNQTLDVDLSVDAVDADTAFFTVRLTNKAGHKFPSGYPSRRAVLQFVVIGSSNDTLFKTGMFDSNYALLNLDPNVEPHYNVITDEGQVQVYQMVPGDVNGNFTSLLERADTMLKDNRIPPDGFVTTANVYDTVKIVGEALTDPDFNRALGTGVEGSGKDYVHFHIPIAGYSQPMKIYATVYYQPLPPEFLADMFTYSSAEIDLFEGMYNAADRSPFMVARDSLINVTLGTEKPLFDELIKLGPNPTSDGDVVLYVPESDDNLKLHLYDANGRFIHMIPVQSGNTEHTLHLPATKGVYMLSIYYKGKYTIRKLIRN